MFSFSSRPSPAPAQPPVFEPAQPSRQAEAPLPANSAASKPLTEQIWDNIDTHSVLGTQAQEAGDKERAIDEFSVCAAEAARGIRLFPNHPSLRQPYEAEASKWSTHVDKLRSARNIGKKAEAESMSLAASGDKADKEIDDKVRGCLVTDEALPSLDDVKGCIDAKRAVNSTIIWPRKMPQLYKKVRPTRGVLMYGVPGTGKTMMAKAVARELAQIYGGKAAFFNVQTADIGSRDYGASERFVQRLFHVAADEAKKSGVAVIFIDEIDAIMGRRGPNDHEASLRIKVQLFQGMDGLKGMQNVVVIGATNRPDSLDEAGLRRFTKQLEVPLPDAETRRTMLKNELQDLSPSLSEADYDVLVARTEHFSGAEIAAAVANSADKPIERIFAAESFDRLADGRLQVAPGLTGRIKLKCHHPEINKHEYVCELTLGDLLEEIGKTVCQGPSALAALEAYKTKQQKRS